MGRGLTSAPTPAVDRASPNDLTNLAVDHGPAPMNIAAVLVIEGAGDLAFQEVRALLEERLPRVPRLRQRLVRPPLGFGRPYWVDDPRFDLEQHLGEVELDGIRALRRSPNGGLLDAAADLVCRRLRQDRPLWEARWVTGLGDGDAALVLVVHHVLADGLGGLAVLETLGDEAAEVDDLSFPRPGPRTRDLAEDAWREHLGTLRDARAVLARTLHGLRELGLAGQRPSLAPATAFNRPTGSRRRLTTVTVPLGEVVALAHRRGCTVNDVVLTAIVGALAGSLGSLGQPPGTLVVSVPISSRRSATADQLGNRTGVVPMTLPTTPDPHERLGEVAAMTRSRRSTSRGSSAAPMGVVFRTLGRLRLFQPFIDRQRLINTFVTNVRGPGEALHLGGHRVTSVVPVAVNPGNVGVSFDILSYAGQLGITVVADPDVVPDQEQLTHLLSDELRQLLNQ